MLKIYKTIDKSDYEVNVKAGQVRYAPDLDWVCLVIEQDEEFNAVLLSCPEDENIEFSLNSPSRPQTKEEIETEYPIILNASLELE